ncbi:polysaccharide biosynthesis protein [Bacillus sp. AGMB 02131]|uniref:Polysaccharide biosynthesis protein n=1 Tax=Peribacillus faecalis TaxID=2772559 RepID=A0A927CWL4_9BACI|nr:polysaccharide biosynthesis protein [Peribacillus faecalis]
MKILSALYRIPYQNIVGDVGFYTYQQVYPFYAFALVLSTYGFPVVISKLLAELKEDRNDYTRTEIIVVSATVLSIISMLLFLLLFFGAESIADIMNDPMLLSSLQIVSVGFLFIPFISILKGLFQSEGETTPTAVSQVVEQSVRVGCILLFAVLFYYYGLSFYEVSEGAFLGSIFGSVAGGIVLLLYYRKNKKKEATSSFSSIRIRRNYMPLVRMIIGQGLIFSFTSLVMVFIQFVDALLLYPLLSTTGLEEIEAKQWKGIYDRGQPLLQLGTSATIALSLTIVPLISKYKQQGNLKIVEKYTDLTFRLSFMLGTAAAVGLFCMMDLVNTLLFTNESGSQALQILVLSILFCSLMMTGTFVLQSLGNTMISIVFILFGLLVKFLLMIYLVPKMQIAGAAISTTVCFMIMALLVMLYIRKVMKKSMFFNRALLIIFQAAVMMSILLTIERWFFSLLIDSGSSRLALVVQVLIMVGTGAVTYLYYVIRRAIFSAEELALLPFGSKLAKFLPKDE